MIDEVSIVNVFTKIPTLEKYKKRFESEALVEDVTSPVTSFFGGFGLLTPIMQTWWVQLRIKALFEKVPTGDFKTMVDKTISNVKNGEHYPYAVTYKPDGSELLTNGYLYQLIWTIREAEVEEHMGQKR